LRQKKARLLGYPTFADYVLEVRMARSKERVRSFLLDLFERVRTRFQEETEELREFFARKSGLKGEEFMPWDLPFYAERMKEERFLLSEEDLRPYFPLDGVLSGLFSLSQILFDIRIEEVSLARGAISTWHPDVRVFRVSDSRGYDRGGFYLDLFPRPGKRTGAWMNGLVMGGKDLKGGFRPHVGVICANLTPPGETQPSLLTFSEVETLFHEFGHLLHHLLSDVSLPALGGTRVAWDFVEVPSQFLENFCYEKEVVRLFSRHWIRGDPLPEEWIEILRAQRNFRATSELVRQVSYALLDLELHSEFDPSKEDPVAFAYKLLSPFSPAPLPPDYAMICTFHHLFDDPVGYAAGYYSYKWSEVLEADLFRQFAREGVLNTRLGIELRETILSRGDSEDPELLFRSLMGRDPDPYALLERIFATEH
jgi:oligopeptidase A